MVGSAIWRTLNFKGYTNLIGASSKELTWETNKQSKILWLPKTGSDYWRCQKWEGSCNNDFRISSLWKTCKSKIIDRYRNPVWRSLFLGSSCIYQNWRHNR
jgi:GDP-L-fucose synthase